MKREPKQVFLTEIFRRTGLKESDFKNLVEYSSRTLTSVVGEARNGKLYIAENGFIRQFTPKQNGHWNCKVLSKITF